MVSELRGNNGFTLIELLVVISIIGLLASVVLVALNSARVKARDVKRKTDITQIQKALEIYYDKIGGYPAMGGTGATTTNGHYANTNPGCVGTACDWANLSGPLVSQGIVNSLPVDPINVASGAFEWGNPPGFSVNKLYHYFSNGTFGSSDANHYILCTWLENQSDPDSLQFKDVGDPYSPGKFLHGDDGYSAYNFCRSQ